MVNRFTISIVQDGEMLMASVKEMRGCHTQADNINDLLDNLKEAIAVSVEDIERELPLGKKGKYSKTESASGRMRGGF